MTTEDKSPKDKIIAAIERNTEAIDHFRRDVGSVGLWLFLIWLGICVIGCPRAKAAPLVSDGDEIASVGKEVRQ